MDWNDVRYFLALARSGSIRAAGASLGVSHSTVARRVEALEELLTTRLFDRHRDGYQLTEAGKEMVPAAERVELEMNALERRQAGRDERFAGPITLTCCDDYVSEIVLEDLSQFCGDHPDIELVLKTDSRAYDLSKREADIAIRTLAANASPPEHLLGTKLVPVTCANYVARTHAERLDPEQGGAESRWVAFADRRTAEAMIATSSYPDLPVWGGFSSISLMIQAARAGLGIVILPTYAGDQEPSLCRLAKPDIRHVADLWLLSHPDLRNNSRLKEARQCIRRALLCHAELFAGEAG